MSSGSLVKLPALLVAIAVIGGCGSTGSGLGDPVRSGSAVAWDIVGIGQDGKRLRLAYDASCAVDVNGGQRVLRRATSERGRAVRVSLRWIPPASACVAVDRVRRTWVRHRAPIAGRRIEGGPRIRQALPAATRFPRLRGLAVEDAVRAAARQGLLVTTVGQPFGAVVKQWPRPGRAVPGKRVHRRLKLKLARG